MAVARNSTNRPSEDAIAANDINSTDLVANDLYSLLDASGQRHF